MSDAKINVDAGACRFRTTIQAAASDDMMTVKLTIVSDCPNVKKLASKIGDVDSMDAVASRILDNGLMRICSEFIPHPACPIPCALVKACEVAMDTAVKKDVTITFG